jgi:hypothetical protein
MAKRSGWYKQSRRHAIAARKGKSPSIYSKRGASKARRLLREKHGFKSSFAAEKERKRLIQEFRAKPIWQQNLHRDYYEAELRRLDVMTGHKYAWQAKPWD